MKKAILITDGPSNTDRQLTLPNAQQLRNVGAEMIAVGVGRNVDQTELQVSIVSIFKCNKKKVFQYDANRPLTNRIRAS